LAQADGICHELTGEQLYARDRKDNRPRLAAKLEDVETDDFLLASLIGPLVTPTAVSATVKERVNLLKDILNRHLVLHGESLDTTVD
jgi:hypothetical protein